MTISRTAAINLACDLIGAKSSDGRHIYFDDATGDHWIATNSDMVDLGERIDAGDADAYSLWCTCSSGDEVDIETIVLDWELTEDTDLDQAQAKALGELSWPAYMALRFLGDEIKDIIAVNAEIAAAQ